MNKTKETNGSINGFFAATGTEIISITEKKVLNTEGTGRMGIHYNKQVLIDTIKSSDKSWKNKDIGIVEVQVPREVIVQATNEDVFGIKKGNILPIEGILPISACRN